MMLLLLRGPRTVDAAAADTRAHQRQGLARPDLALVRVLRGVVRVGSEDISCCCR